MNLIKPYQADSHTGGVVVFFPHAGGSPRFFSHLAAALSHCRVFGVTYPGRDHLIDSEPITEMSLLSSKIATELAVRFEACDEPLVLVGHSLGAFVAYETAAHLKNLPHSVQTVVVASGQNPPLPRNHQRPRALQNDEDIITDVIRQNPASAPIWRNPELRSFFLPIMRADYALLENYQPSQSQIEDLKIIVADRDFEVTQSCVWQWQQFSQNPIEVIEVTGGHFYLESPDLQLAQQLLCIPSLKLRQKGNRTYDRTVSATK